MTKGGESIIASLAIKEALSVLSSNIYLFLQYIHVYNLIAVKSALLATIDKNAKNVEKLVRLTIKIIQLLRSKGKTQFNLINVIKEQLLLDDEVLNSIRKLILKELRNSFTIDELDIISGLDFKVIVHVVKDMFSTYDLLVADKVLKFTSDDIEFNHLAQLSPMFSIKLTEILDIKDRIKVEGSRLSETEKVTKTKDYYINFYKEKILSILASYDREVEKMSEIDEDSLIKHIKMDIEQVIMQSIVAGKIRERKYLDPDQVKVSVSHRPGKSVKRQTRKQRRPSRPHGSTKRR